MTKQKFFYIVTLLAKVIFPSEKAPIEIIFASLLSERTNVAKDLGDIHLLLEQFINIYNIRLSKSTC